MGGVKVAWKLLLHLLFLLIIAQVHVQSRKITFEENQIPKGEIDQGGNLHDIHDDHDSKSKHHDHMDTNIMVFFTLKDLKLGQKIPIYIPKKDINKAPHFLPRHEADSIPFSSESLETLLDYFSFAPGSPQATAMSETLTQCESRPIEGETKTCATSLESMLDFAEAAFGPTDRLATLTTAFTIAVDSITTFQNHTVSRDPVEVPAPRMVACHTMPYPYAVFYCHWQESESRVFKVALKGDNGDEAVAVAVCHMDTSKWSPSHVSFKVLGFGPGTQPVCHFFPAEHLLWVPLMPPASSSSAII